MTFAILTIWYLLGVCGFIFWWTKDLDFGGSEIPLALIVGAIGPFAWLLGWAIHGNEKVLIKKRSRE